MTCLRCGFLKKKRFPFKHRSKIREGFRWGQQGISRQPLGRAEVAGVGWVEELSGQRDGGQAVWFIAGSWKNPIFEGYF